MPQPSLLSRLFATLDRDRRLLVQIAMLYAASGLFHVVVWIIDGGAWAGDVSWRKPIVFGLSGAITTASLAWALGAVKPSSMTLEIALITMQRWRGVASHFNTDTLTDGVVFQLMGILIVIASVPIVRWTITVLRDRTLAPERRAAVGGGLALLVVGLVVGLAIAQLGSVGRIVEIPSLVTAARGLVPAHALALHGIQAMALLGWLLPRFVTSGARRVALLHAATIGGLVVIVIATLVGVMS
jgi:hypothetical protein